MSLATYQWSSLRLVLASLCVMVGSSCRPSDDSATAPGGGGNGAASFVGGAACATCHPSEFERWQTSDHARSMQPATADTVLGRFEGERLDMGDKFVEFFRRDGQFWMRTDDLEGVQAGQSIERRIEYTFGFDPLQQYLVELDGGRLQALNVAWDTRPETAGGQRWFDLYAGERLSPSDPLHWTGVLHNWNGRCAACHSTHVEKRYAPAADTFDTRFASVDVDCEACHGPGGAHVADPGVTLRLGRSARANWTFGSGPIAVPDRAAGGDAVELDTCAPCHSRRAQFADARVGDAFLDTFEPSLLIDPLYFVDGQIRDEVFVYGSFLQSAMHGAGVTCTDCHDAHSGDVRATGDALCFGCHRAEVFGDVAHHRHREETRAPLCVDCHMPERTYMRIDPRRDHSLRVPRPDLTVALGVPNACGNCHASEGAQWAAARIAEWFPNGRATQPHYAEDLAAGRSWAADRSMRLRRLAADPASPAIVRATAIELLSRQLDAPALDVIAAALEESEPLLVLAALRALAAAPPELERRLGQRFLDDSRLTLRIAAANALVDARDGLSASRQMDLDAALEEYERALGYNRETAEARHGLGLLREQQGDFEQAERLYRAAIAVDASYAPAYVNLADLYRRTNREALGNALLEDVSRTSLGSEASVQAALGLSDVRLGNIDAAQESLARAAALAPDDPYYAYVSALAGDAEGDRAASEQSLRAAHDRFPGYAPILFALATMRRDAGDNAGALEYVEELLQVAPGDTTGRALRDELLGGR